MGVTCQILINKPRDGVHRAGGTVTGVVKYAIGHPTTFKDIVFSLKGESYCSWSETDSDDNSTTYTGREEHVCQSVSLLMTSTLPAGAYEHKFQFRLPRYIPPSFNRSTGNVTYQLLLEFKREGLFNFNKKFDAKIPVENYLDPTLPDNAVIFGVDKTLIKPFSFGKQEIRLKAEIANSYLRPGDKAELKFMIINDSSSWINCIRAELVGTTVFTATGGNKSTSTEKYKCRVETAEIAPRNKATMTAAVPTLPEHRTVQYSKVVSHQYKILVTARLPWPHCNFSTTVPVLIGEKEEYAAVEEGVDIVRAINADSPPPPYWAQWADMDECKENVKNSRRKKQ